MLHTKIAKNLKVLQRHKIICISDMELEKTSEHSGVSNLTVILFSKIFSGNHNLQTFKIHTYKSVNKVS